MLLGVLFDLDGVLVSTDRFHYEAWLALANRLGIPFDEEMNHQLRGVSRRESLMVILGKRENRFTEAQLMAFSEEKNQTYVALLETLGPEAILPGVLETLDYLDGKGIKMAVASSSQNAKLILGKVDLLKRFEVVVDGTQIVQSKPNPEVFLRAVEGLNLNPNAVLVVEDALSGIQAAKAAQMKVWAVGPFRNYEAADFGSMYLSKEKMEVYLHDTLFIDS